MSDFPYTNVTGKLQKFFQKIQSIGVPPSATTKWLPSIGFGSKNDRPIIAIAKFIGFIDHSNNPTQRWISYRDSSKAKSVMAEGICEGYSELFNLHDDAYERDDEDLKNFFRSKSTAGEQVISKTVGTFKALCSLADFNKIETKQDQEEKAYQENFAEETNNLPVQSPPSSPNSPSLHIDIQIHIASDATPEQIDKIFESMAKHLYNKDSK